MLSYFLIFGVQSKSNSIGKMLRIELQIRLPPHNGSNWALTLRWRLFDCSGLLLDLTSIYVLVYFPAFSNSSTVCLGSVRFTWSIYRVLWNGRWYPVKIYSLSSDSWEKLRPSRILKNLDWVTKSNPLKSLTIAPLITITINSIQKLITWCAE